MLSHNHKIKSQKDSCQIATIVIVVIVCYFPFSVMSWQEFQKHRAEGTKRHGVVVRPDESMLNGMSIEQIEMEFR